MSTLSEILERRARLVAEAAAQRRAIAEGFEGSRRLLSLADRALAVTAWLRARPYLVIAVAAVVAALRPRLAFGLSARLLGLSVRLLGLSTRLVAFWRAGRLLSDAIRPAARDRALDADRSVSGS